MSKYTIISLRPIEEGGQERHEILRSAEYGGGQFPMDESNRDYREYLEWLNEGNTPEQENN